MSSTTTTYKRKTLFSETVKINRQAIKGKDFVEAIFMGKSHTLGRRAGYLKFVPVLLGLLFETNGKQTTLKIEQTYFLPNPDQRDYDFGIKWDKINP